jgi:cysteine desulfurase family protein (TIGR01976 family)
MMKLSPTHQRGSQQEESMFDVYALRRQFPALFLIRNGQSPIFLDGPGGTQVPKRVIDAMVHYLTTCNANHGGCFATSRVSDQILASAHQAMADMLHAPSPNEIVFGQNMTTLTLHLSRALGKTLKAGDEVMVTRLDHDANVTPWMLMARDAGSDVRYVDIHPEDGTLDFDDLRRQLGPRTRFIAVGAASNALGTVNNVCEIARCAHAVGAKVFVDAVHYAPHGPIDVHEWECDFLVCSAYKFFGPHVGVLWGRRELLEDLPAYKVRPASNTIPDRWMTGTQNHEGLAGVAAAVDYVADIGAANPSHQAAYPKLAGRCLQIHAGLAAIQEYESQLGRYLLDGLRERPRFKVWGITSTEQLAHRVPTFALTRSDRTSAEMAQHLAVREIYSWSGNLYAVLLAERLGVEGRGGFLRLGLIHYNTREEIDRLMQALDEL